MHVINMPTLDVIDFSLKDINKEELLFDLLQLYRSVTCKKMKNKIKIMIIQTFGFNTS